MPDDGAVEEQLRVVARQAVKAFAALKPVVALIAQHHVATRASQQEVAVFAGKGLLRVRAKNDEVMAATTKGKHDA